MYHICIRLHSTLNKLYLMVVQPYFARSNVQQRLMSISKRVALFRLLHHYSVRHRQTYNRKTYFKGF